MIHERKLPASEALSVFEPTLVLNVDRAPTGRKNSLTRSLRVANEFVLKSRMIFCSVSKTKEYFLLDDEIANDVTVHIASSGSTGTTPRRGSKMQLEALEGFG